MMTPSNVSTVRRRIEENHNAYKYNYKGISFSSIELDADGARMDGELYSLVLVNCYTTHILHMDGISTSYMSSCLTFMCESSGCHITHTHTNDISVDKSGK